MSYFCFYVEIDDSELTPEVDDDDNDDDGDINDHATESAESGKK